MSPTFAILLGLLAAHTVTAQNPKDCIPAGQYNAATDYFPEKINIADPNSSIKVTYEKNYKIVKNEYAKKTYVLVQCGTPPPANVPADAVFEVPVKSVALADTTSVTYLELLGARQTIKASSSAEFTSSACLQKMTKENTVQSINSNNASASATVFSTVGMVIGNGEEKNTTNVIEFPATRDFGVLRRSEYLSYLAPFFNQEALANKLSDSVAETYNCLKTPAQAAASKNGQPVVAWISQFSGNMTINPNPIWAEYTTTAGGKPITIQGPTTFSDKAAFATALKDVDVVIDMSLVNDMDSFTKVYSPSSDAKFMKSPNVYGITKRGNALGTGTDWFESAVVNEHAIVADLVSIFHPEVVGKDFQRTYLKSLKGEESVVKIGAEQCPDVAQPAELIKVACPSGESKEGVKSWNANSAVRVGGVFGVVVGVVVGLVVM